MADTTYVQRLAAAMGVPEERATWSSDDKARARALAGHLDVSPQAIDKYFRDGSKAMSAPNNSRTARYLKVDPDWLATGEGEMRGARAWPLGDAVSPSDFFALGPAEVRPAIDVLVAAVARRKAPESGVRSPNDGSAKAKAA